MQEPPSMLSALAALLKSPGRVFYQLGADGGKKLTAILLVCSIICLAIFGFLLGTFSGGQQLWRVPTKIVLGVLASGLICLPSLIIFSLLSGCNCSITRLVALLVTMLTLMGRLLLGFAPVIWVFAQSSSEVGFMGGLGILVWTLTWVFAMRLILNLAARSEARNRGPLIAWGCIFLLVTFQMTATLRPIVGESDSFLPSEKMSFLQHWFGFKKRTSVQEMTPRRGIYDSIP